MKRKIIVALLLILTMICSLFAFTGCGDKASGEKQVPVYQGMTITNTSTSTMSLMGSSYRSGEIILLSANKENNGDNGNHNGHYKGDHTDRNDTIDEENPYPENDENENIEEEIKSSLNVIGSPDTIYYAEPNQDIYINIHIDNPDSFEIMSFTLNGKKYSSYMFEEGSDMETIVLKYNVGDTAGIVEYTIDAIKYIDGTEIKDVIIDGNKTVMAGIRTQNQVAASITNVAIDTNAISFNVTVKDNNSLIEFSEGALKAVVYDGFNIVSEKDIAVGENAVTFNGLKTNTLYQCAIVGYYDDLSGNGFGMNVLYKDAFYTDSVVLFDNITVGQESISFGYLWHEDHQNKTISALELYKGDNFVKDLTANINTVSELLSNTTYKLVAEYLNADNTESIYLEFTTLAKATPEISLANPTTTQTTVGFEIIETDADNVGAVTKIELVHASGAVISDSLEQRAFANLFSNNDYTVKVTYTYDLNDGIGAQTIVKELTVKTESKSAPSFAPKNENITTDNISAEYDITDVDSILSSYKVELYKGENLVSENTEKKISFASLDYNTDYTLKITYTYDLNDGNGVQIKAFEKAYKTLPYIDVIECNIANTSAVSEGETIYMQVKLDNPLGMTIESVTVNGKAYNVTGASTKNKLFVEIVYNGQFAGGDTYLKVDQVNAKLDGVPHTVAPKTEVSDNVFINGKLEVSRIEFVNEAFEPINWAFPSDMVYVLVTLNNPTGYIVDSIQQYRNHSDTTVTALTKLDDNRWYYKISLYDGVNEILLKSLDYHNASVSKTLTYSDMSSSCYRVKSDTPVYVSKSDDLKNMDGGYYYELTGDIDLAGIEWVGNELNGVFDGKGFAIRNMSFVGTVKNKDAFLGLFSYGTGVVQNLNVKDATVIAEVTADDGNRYNAYCGALAAEARDFLHIQNCTVDAYSIFDLKNTTGNSCYAGGLVGYIYYAAITITNCTNSGNVSSTGQSYDYAGGLVGYIQYGAATITNCTNTGNVSAICLNSGYSANAGGLVGYIYMINVTITNCTNSGSVSSTDYAGGLVGEAYDSTVMITNCTNSGNISATGQSYDYAGGLVGRIGGNVTITNCINSGSVSSTGECDKGYAGGLVGYIQYGAATITNCTNSGSVSSSDQIYVYSGGLVGCIEQSAATITNCTNSGSVSSTSQYDDYSGGLVGSIEYSSTATITNCTNSGSVSATDYAGGLVGRIYDGTVTITNCYSIDVGNDEEHGETCTVEQLNSKEFYTETLGWSEDVWDFSELDVENGKYPKLKQ